jgi:ABC-type transporter Mla subunit MlaD
MRRINEEYDLSSSFLEVEKDRIGVLHQNQVEKGTVMSMTDYLLEKVFSDGYVGRPTMAAEANQTMSLLSYHLQGLGATGSFGRAAMCYAPVEGEEGTLEMAMLDRAVLSSIGVAMAMLILSVMQNETMLDTQMEAVKGSQNQKLSASQTKMLQVKQQIRKARYVSPFQKFMKDLSNSCVMKFLNSNYGKIIMFAIGAAVTIASFGTAGPAVIAISSVLLGFQAAELILGKSMGELITSGMDDGAAKMALQMSIDIGLMVASMAAGGGSAAKGGDSAEVAAKAGETVEMAQEAATAATATAEAATELAKATDATAEMVEAANKVSGAATDVSEALDGVAKAANELADTFTAAGDSQEAIDKATKALQEAQDKLQKAQETMKGAMDKFDDAVANAGELGESTQKLVTQTKEMGKKTMEMAGQAQEMGNKAVEKTNEILAKAKAALNGVTDKVDDVTNNADDVIDKADDVANNVDDVIDKADDVADNVDDVIDKADDVADNADDVIDKADDVADNADDVIDKADDVANNADDVIDKVDDVANNVDDATNKADDAADKADDAAKKADDVADKADDAGKASSLKDKMKHGVKSAARFAVGIRGLEHLSFAQQMIVAVQKFQQRIQVLMQVYQALYNLAMSEEEARRMATAAAIEAINAEKGAKMEFWQGIIDNQLSDTQSLMNKQKNAIEQAMAVIREHGETTREIARNIV